jgi:hypothetical protein
MLPNAAGPLSCEIKENATMQRAPLFAAAALFLTAGICGAQETKDTAKTLLQNERVRVMEVSFKPGAKTSAVSQPNRFLYALTDGALVFAPPGKTPFEFKEGGGRSAAAGGKARAGKAARGKGKGGRGKRRG